MRAPFLSAIVVLCAVPVLRAAEGDAPPAAPLPAEKPPIIAVYDLDGPLSESGRAQASLLSLDTSRSLTLFELSRSLGRARTDAAVKAVVLDVDGAAMDGAQLDEIRSHLQAIRKAGKDVWLYTEQLSNATALLGSAANHFALMPEADCSFHGIFSEQLYFKGLLDKAGLRADVIHIGDFKSFGETFYRTGPSDYAKQQTEALVDSVFGHLVATVAAGRGLTPEQVAGLIDDGTLTAEKAVAAGLADHAMFRTDFVKKLRETYGAKAKFDRGYQLPNLDGPQIEGMMDIVKLLFERPASARSTRDFVAVVALDGDISDESVAPVRSQVLKLVKDDKAKALVLRVNSPGGSALASEVLWEALDEWKQTGRPYVVSMGGVAASGGYYVSAGADRIFAEPATITGSIGVVGMKFVLEGAMAKLGVTSHATQRGKVAGMQSMTRGFTEEEAGLVRQSMEDVYGTFKKRVTEGRGAALKDDLDKLAGGRVFSGEDALAVGLVDELGGLADAIIHARRMSKVEKLEVRLVPEPTDALSGLLAKAEKDKDEIIRAGGLSAPGRDLRTALVHLGLFDALPAAMRREIGRLSTRLEAFQKCRVLMLGPDIHLNF